MRGLEVKNILLKNGYKLKDVAESMGETPQNLNSMLSVEDIKTGVLERIANSINKSLYFFTEGDDRPDSDISIRLLGLLEAEKQEKAKLLEIIEELSKKLPASTEGQSSVAT